MVPAKVKDDYVIRFTVTSFYTTKTDIKRDWEIIKTLGAEILVNIQKEDKINEIERKFQSSLLLSNVPKTPKLMLHNAANTLVNASFLAFDMETSDILYDLVRELSTRDYSQSHLPLIPRRKPKFLTAATQKGLSFDQLNLSKKHSLDATYISGYYNSEFSQGAISSNENDDVGENSKSSKTLFVLNLQNGKKSLSKQTSLDSKIEYICEEVEEAEINNSNNNNNNNNEAQQLHESQ